MGNDCLPQEKIVGASSKIDAMESSNQCIEIVVRWGAGVVCVKHLSPPRSFYVGDASLGPVDCFLPLSACGFARIPLVWVQADGSVHLVVLPKATGVLIQEGEAKEIPLNDRIGTRMEATELSGLSTVVLAMGTKARIELGGFDIEVGLVRAGKAVAGHFYLDKKALPYHALSTVLHVSAMVWCAFAVPSLSETVAEDNDITVEQVYLMQRFLNASAEREEEASETEKEPDRRADSKEGGSGTRAKGEEGSMGRLAGAKGNKMRFGTSGTSQGNGPDPLQRRQAYQEAAEFGMIGLLNSGTGGDPNAPSAPWGSDSGQGDSVSYGMGGFGVSGTGFGGGGGPGPQGLGSIGTIGHGSGGGVGQTMGVGRGVTPPVPQYATATAGAGNGPKPMFGSEYAPTEAPIDPNGRFATTYRPGGGHLSAFESAVSRGVVPSSERELVSDIGARYTPPLAVPEGKALAFRADLERLKIAPSGAAFHVRLSLAGSPEKPAERPHLSVHLVLDVSGSMEGEPLEKAKEAAQKLVDQLAPSDEFSLVTFADSAEVNVPNTLVGPRREAIKSVIRSLKDWGGTNIYSGLNEGYAQARKSHTASDAVRVVLLLSDGRATSGTTFSPAISRLALDAFQDGIQTSALGLGSDYDGQLMSSIASDGAGGYYYLKDGDQIASALSMELSKRLDPVATALELRVRLKNGTNLLRVYGSRRLNQQEAAAVRSQEIAADIQASRRDGIAQDRHEDREGGMRFFIPAFARDDSHSLLLKLQVPEGIEPRSIASIELKYKDRIAKKNVVEEIPLRIDYASSDAESAASADATVVRTVHGFSAGETLSAAAARIAAGDRSSAIAMLSEREGILEAAANTLNEPLFRIDAMRLARLRSFAGSTSGMGDPLVLSMLMETAGRVHLH